MIPTRVRRVPERGRYDRPTIDAILDEAFVCHVGFLDQGQPVVIPINYARSGDRLLLHGSTASRMMRTLAEGVPVSVAVTLIDGLVLARSAFHHSVNYRSVVVFGRGAAITSPAEKIEALRIFMEKVTPGRWNQVRPPSPRELAATMVVAIGIDQASAKVRTGPPIDDETDYALPVWAGVVPLSLTRGTPVEDAGLPRQSP